MLMVVIQWRLVHLIDLLNIVFELRIQFIKVVLSKDTLPILAHHSHTIQLLFHYRTHVLNYSSHLSQLRHRPFTTIRILLLLFDYARYLLFSRVYILDLYYLHFVHHTLRFTDAQTYIVYIDIHTL